MASFLDLFTATDSSGTSAARYRLHYLGSQYLHQDSWIFGMVTELIYMVFKFLVVPANALLGLVLSSGSWLDPLSQAYQKVTAPLFVLFPPWAIACFGLGVVAVSVMYSRPAATTAGMLNSESLNRVGTALGMVAAVLILTHDPFAMVAKVLELANGFSVDLAAAVTNSSSDTTMSAGQALVDNSIRTPTIALNYGREFSEHCREQWSEAMVAGQALAENTGCFIKGQNEAGPDTVGTALIMVLLPALPMLAFSVVAAWKYVLHLTLAVLSLLSTGWIAAASVHRRRGFDRLSEAIARAGAHLAMAVITSMVAVALPALCSGLATDLLGLTTSAQTQAFALMVSLGIGFAISTWVIVRITSNSSALVRLLRADVNMTLEHTLGTSSAAKLKYTAHKFNPLTAAPSEPGAAPAKKSALAANPVSATTPTAALMRQPKGATDVQNPVTTDASAVEQLTAGASSVADAASDPAPPTVDLTNTPDPQAPPANRAWQPQFAGPPTHTGGDVYGYVFTAAPTAGDGDDDPERPTAEDADHALVSVGPADPVAAAVGTPLEGSVLAAPVPAVPGGAAETPRAPVAGNVYADPALDAVARSAGATFTAAGEQPVARRVLPWMRSFSPTPPVEPVPFAAPEVAQGPPLIIVGSEMAGGGDEVVVPGAEAEPVNEQQRWNRLARWRSRRTRDVTSPLPEVTLPSSGIGAGVNRHPGSFCAPLPDFLDADALEAELGEITTAMAAAGRRINVALAPEDRRMGVRFSSDPDQRVVRIGGDGFGDPI